MEWFELAAIIFLILMITVAYIGYRAYKRSAEARQIAEVFWDSEITEKWNKEFGRDRNKN